MLQDASWYGGRPRPKRRCVRWGHSSPSQKGGTAPNFCPMFVVAKRLDGSRCHLVCRWVSAEAALCYVGTQLPSPERGTAPPNFWPLSVVAKWSPISGTAEHLFILFYDFQLAASAWAYCNSHVVYMCMTAFHLCDNHYVWTIDVQYYHHNEKVLHHFIISHLVSESNQSVTVVWNDSGIYWPHARYCVW